ncbi:Cyanase [Exidia glandulosa HHB12029]|uniref:Cyanate hydratase n=1 Tax=Exidia glandulosa HHB12029 TaxID=1314781 RepID=A0A165G7R1_EXIGL|nr:Cyanase [Exidia glandulosa HHB12029]KZV92153.1 Cyanase [Exidia glandulosa HHB12029]
MQAATVSTSSAPLNELPPWCATLQEAKARKGLSFEQIAKELGRNEIWVASVFLAQAKPTPADIEALEKVLGLESNALAAQAGSHWWPERGIGPAVPTDPLLYRLYEGVLVYGHPIKAVIHEKFGDGIMSMIDCKVDVQRKADPKGDRVVLTFDGKFLPYVPW